MIKKSLLFYALEFLFQILFAVSLYKQVCPRTTKFQTAMLGGLEKTNKR